MTRYFFDIHDGKIVPDDIGTELHDLTAAREHSRNLIIGLAADMSLVRDAVQLRINVRDLFDKRVITGTLLLILEDAQ